MADIETTPSNFSAEFSNDISADTSPAGERLRIAREARNMSVEDAARQLRLSTHQILAIEQDDFVKLPEPMIARGFIRNYAKLLDVDATPLLQAFKIKMPDVGLAKLSLSSERIVLQSYDKKSYLTYVITSIFLLVGLAAWWLYMSFVATPSSKQSSDDSAQRLSEQSAGEQNTSEFGLNGVTDADGQLIVTEPLPPQALPAAERLAEANSLESTSVLGEAPPTSVIQTNPATVPAVPNTPLLASPVIAGMPQANDAAAATASLSGSVSFSASEKTWVRVLDMENNVIYERTIEVGGNDRFAFKPPVKIVVGNAAGTKLSYKNQPVDLSASTRNNVARLTLE